MRNAMDGLGLLILASPARDHLAYLKFTVNNFMLEDKESEAHFVSVVRNLRGLRYLQMKIPVSLVLGGNGLRLLRCIGKMNHVREIVVTRWHSPLSIWSEQERWLVEQVTARNRSIQQLLART